MLANHRASRAFALSALVAAVATASASTASASGEGTAPKAAVQPDTALPNLVISQVYGGGGSDGATFANEFVEIFNAGTTSVSLSGMSLQYADASSAFSSGNTFDLSSKTIPAGDYYLVQFYGAGNGAGLPAPDDTNNGTIDLDPTNGKVALVSTTTPLTCTSGKSCKIGTTSGLIDLVGYGSSLDFAGAGAAPATSPTTAAIRKTEGCTNTDSNSADFTVSTPTPRNSASPAASPACGITPIVDAGTTDAGTTDSGTTPPTAASLVISQVYGGYNYFDSTYDQNFVELFNAGGTAISLSGYSVQTASATGGFGVATDGGTDAPDVVMLPAASVPPGGYYLVGMTAGTDAGANLPAPVDFAAAAYLNYKSGKVALVHGTTAIGCGGATNPCAAGTYVDLVGYGTPSQSEGSAPTAALGDALSAQRDRAGCTDTNNNAADFTVAVPAARNSATAKNVCSGVTIAGDGGTATGSDSGTTTGSDSGTTSGDDDDDDDDTLGNPDASTGGINEISDANSGGCSTHGRSSGNWGGAVGFGLFAAAIALFVRRRRNSR